MDPAAEIEPESARYSVDLVLVHGLWVGPAVWRAAASSFAHRGWRCVLADGRVDALVGRGPGRRPGDGFLDWCDGLARLLDERPAPVALVGHDVGALVALALAGHSKVRAVVAVAPLLNGVSAIIPRSQRWGARLFGMGVPPPDALHPLFAAEPPAIREAFAAIARPESAARSVSLDRRALQPGAASVPRLLVAHRDDPAVDRVAVEITASGIEAEFTLLPGGHWPLLGAGADAWAGEIHRWLVRRLGESLLLFRGDEDLEP